MILRCKIFGHEWIIYNHVERIVDWQTKEVTTEKLFCSHCLKCGVENPGIKIAVRRNDAN